MDYPRRKRNEEKSRINLSMMTSNFFGIGVTYNPNHLYLIKYISNFAHGLHYTQTIYN